MGKQCKVSAIMGVYNCAETLESAIVSILGQTYTDWEFIICDDNSSDRSYAICKEYANKYPEKIKLLKNETNKRLSFTLNRCIEEASGEYLARMDADDVALPDRFRVQVHFLDAHQDVAWIGSSVDMIDNNGKWGTRKQMLNPSKLDIYLHNQFVHPSVMMRKNAAVAVGGYTVSKATRRGQDYDMWCKLTAKGFIGKNIPDVLLDYREDRNSFTKKKFEYRLDSVTVRKKWFKELDIPKKYLYTVYRPLFAAAIPKTILQLIHRWNFSR